MSNETIPMVPSVGRVVHYRLTANDAQRTNKRRDDARHSRFAENSIGTVVHIGNPVGEGEVVPLIVVRVWADEYARGAAPGKWVDDKWVPFEVLGPEGVNGQAILDGNDSLWVCSASQGPNPGQWMRPPVVA